jgi:hypothetical protein
MIEHDHVCAQFNIGKMFGMRNASIRPQSGQNSIIVSRMHDFTEQAGVIVSRYVTKYAPGWE